MPPIPNSDPTLAPENTLRESSTVSPSIPASSTISTTRSSQSESLATTCTQATELTPIEPEATALWNDACHPTLRQTSIGDLDDVSAYAQPLRNVRVGRLGFSAENDKDHTIESTAYRSSGSETTPFESNGALCLNISRTHECEDVVHPTITLSEPPAASQQLSENFIMPVEPQRRYSRASTRADGFRSSQPRARQAHDTKIQRVSIGIGSLFKIQEDAYISEDIPVSDTIAHIWADRIRLRLELEIERKIRSPSPFSLCCKMAGKSPDKLSPHVVIFCSTAALQKRLTKKIKTYDWIPKSGLQCMITVEPLEPLSVPSTGVYIGVAVSAISPLISVVMTVLQLLFIRRSRNRQTALALDREPGNSKQERESCGKNIALLLSFRGAPLSLGPIWGTIGKKSRCTMGGLLLVGDTLLGLTVAHIAHSGGSSPDSITRGQFNEPAEGSGSGSTLVEFVEFEDRVSSSFSNHALEKDGYPAIENGNGASFYSKEALRFLTVKVLNGTQEHQMMTGTLDHCSSVSTSVLSSSCGPNND